MNNSLPATRVKSNAASRLLCAAALALRIQAAWFRTPSRVATPAAYESQGAGRRE